MPVNKPKKRPRINKPVKVFSTLAEKEKEENKN